MEPELQPGDRLRIGMALAPADDDQVFVLMQITSLADSYRYMPRASPHFQAAEILFGNAAKVLWVADETKTFDGTAVNGFPVIAVDGRTIGLDGLELTVEKVD